MGAVTLEVTIEISLFLRNGERIGGFGEMVHPNIDIAGIGEALDNHLKNRQFFIRRWHIRFIHLLLRFKEMGHMRVVKDRETIGREF